ncbi:hypothetical protein [Pararhizobium arenae]|uniref:hypothetical protein n=1 Tax=Pararhizobium arenae TaxID=1856850 RepID=UPI00094AEA75|nr:hypothetical protein [Pararhizobium arenae]
MPKITKPLALQSLKIAVFSEMKRTYVSFVCGPQGPENSNIFVMSRKNIQTVKGQARQLVWDKEKSNFKPIAYGACRLENGTLYIRTDGNGRGAASVVAKAAQDYFKKKLKITPPWGRVVKEDEPIVEDLFLSDSADETVDLIGDLEIQSLVADAEATFGDAVTDSDGNETLDESDSGSEDGGSSDGERSESDSRDGDEQVPESGPKLDAHLEAEIKTQLEAIVKTLLAVSTAIGLKIDSSEADIIAKLFGWLERMLAGLSPAEQAEAAANWLSRLQLAISSSTQAMRDSTVVAGKNSSSTEDDEVLESGEEKTVADDSKTIPGVDLNNLTTDKLNDDEIVAALFNKAVEMLGDAGAEYDMSSASNGEASKFVKTNKVRLNATDATEVIRTMFALLEQSIFQTRDGLVRFLRLKRLGVSEASQVSDIPEWIAEWKAAHASAVEQVEGVKDAAEKALKEEDESMSVAKLGGTWKYVDDIFVQVDVAEVEAELDNVHKASNDNRAAAIEKASATLQASLSWLSENNIVDLVDNAPFDGAEATVGATLGGSLQGLLERLSSLQARAA